MFVDEAKLQPYEYAEGTADASWQRHKSLGRVHLAVLLEKRVIGEVILKNIDPAQRCCTMGIHLQNDAVKNQGYGTQAELLALGYAFTQLGLDTVYADALQKNKRSQHVLEKVGFVKTHADDTFLYYRCDRAAE